MMDMPTRSSTIALFVVASFLLLVDPSALAFTKVPIARARVAPVASRSHVDFVRPTVVRQVACRSRCGQIPSSIGVYGSAEATPSASESTGPARQGRRNTFAPFLLAAATTALSLTPSAHPLPPSSITSAQQLLVGAAWAYDDGDYASETVTAAVQRLRDAASNADESFRAYENVAEIITEGKGVGGSLSYTGVKLERGYIADEDTAIYNPGLTLLTESEKERIVDAVIANRKAGLAANQWSETNELAYDFLKQKLDPLHMVELRGYLGILPFYGAAVYLAAFAVQQKARSYFPAAYIAGAAAVFGPIIALVALGP